MVGHSRGVCNALLRGRICDGISPSVVRTRLRFAISKPFSLAGTVLGYGYTERGVFCAADADDAHETEPVENDWERRVGMKQE